MKWAWGKILKSQLTLSGWQEGNGYCTIDKKGKEGRKKAEKKANQIAVYEGIPKMDSLSLSGFKWKKQGRGRATVFFFILQL